VPGSNNIVICLPYSPNEPSLGFIWLVDGNGGAVLVYVAHRSGTCSQDCYLRVSVVSIFEPHDIVFAQITAGLHLDDFQWDRAGILEPVCHANRNVRRLVL
jgi:hypothetical protein